MCPAHRKEIISDIRQDLETKKKILVVSTQLIEAGVDFDFPVVFRAIAPLEAIIQSAGRCNREGKLAGHGSVYLFNLKNSGMPDKTYAACAGYAGGIISENTESLYKHDIFTKYHREVISLFSDSDKYKINQAREAFNFEVVNDAYRIIRRVTHGLYVYNYSDESRQLLDFLCHKEFLSKDDYRNMQKFTVQVYQYFIQQNSALCKVLSQGFMVWYGNYDGATGISSAPIDADKLIV
jgi:CRISPR-associated endonuclease/helicase Cas3